MARRGILDYVLSGAVGGLEGLAQQRAAEDEKKRLADALARQQGIDAMERARFLRESGYRVAPSAYDTEDPAARSVLPPMAMPSAAAPSEARASGALSAALGRGFGVDTTKSSLSRPSFGAAPLALDSGVSRMTDVFSRAQETRPAQEAIAASVKTPLGDLRFLAPESEDAKLDRELRKYEAQQGVITARQKAEQDRANRGFFAILSRAKALPEGVTYEEVQDIDLKPFFQEYSQGRSAEAALERANVTARSQAGMGSYVTGLTPEGQPNLFFGTRGGQITPTGVGAPTKSTTEGKIPPADKKNMVELEASIKELDKALASVEKNPNAFGLKTVLPNVGLSRTQGVKPRADVTGAIVKLRRTEFGTAMSRQEKESGESLFPAGGDQAATLKDKLTSLREKAQLELDTKREYYGTQPSASATPTAPAAPAVDSSEYNEAKAAIAKGANPAAVRKRYEENTGKKWPGA